MDVGHDLSPRWHAWYGLLQAGLRTLDRVERDVQEATGLPLAWFEVLTFLHASEEGRRRMGELAEDLLLSRGGATRLIARMEEAGLVTREVPPEDRRATYAVITAAGRDAVERAAPVQQEAVERHFGDAIRDDEAEAVAAMCTRVLEHLGARCTWLDRDAQRRVA